MDQWVDEDVRWSTDERAGFALPERLTIFADCPEGHLVVGEGRCVDSVWTALDVRSYSSLADYTQQKEQRS